MNTLGIAVSSIVLSVMAQFALKAGMSSSDVREVIAQPMALRTIFIVLTNKFVFGGFCLYGLGAIVWLGVLSKWEVSKAYPLVGLGFAFTVLAGLMFGEQVTPLRAAGVALICAGVWVVSKT